MKNFWKIVFVVNFALLTACAAKKESDPRPPISSKPEIKIEKIDPVNANQFETIRFEISYTDGDGDIGTEDADDHALEVLDNRDNILHTFHVAPQSPVENVAISGVLVVELHNIILLDQSNDSEIVTFNVSLKDRAGNTSNVETSIEITVTK